jgi:hypothetical protein
MALPIMWPLEEVHAAYNDSPLLPVPGEAYGCSPTRAVPIYVKDFAAWEHCAERTVNKTGLTYDEWGPKEFAATTAHYKHKARKNARENGHAA